MWSYLKHARPWLLAALTVAGIETAYYLKARPARIDRTNFLTHTFARPEREQRLFTYEKIRAFLHSDPDILLLGDSSGHHAIIPHVTMTEVPGFKLINMGIASNVGYEGYLHLAELMLRHNKNIKYLVLYNSPFALPQRMLWQDRDNLLPSSFALMADDIYNEFLHPGRRLLQLPTLAARKDVFSFVAYRNGKLRAHDAPLSTNEGYLMSLVTHRPCYGWARETDVPGDFPTADVYDRCYGWVRETAPLKSDDERFFDWRSWSEKSYIEHVYGEFVRLARRHGVKPVIVWNPVAQKARTKLRDVFHGDRIEAAMARFRQAHPDVPAPAGIDYWPDEKFSVFSHVSNLVAEEASLRLGRLLKGVIARDGARPKQRPADFLADDAPDHADIDFRQTVCAFGWGPAERNQHGQAWRYVGPCDHCYLYAVVKPGRNYRLRIHFHTVDAPAALRRLRVRVNDCELVEARRVWGGAYYIELRLPREAAARYLGWLKVEFDIRGGATGETAGRKVAVSRVGIFPQAD